MEKKGLLDDAQKDKGLLKAKQGRDNTWNCVGEAKQAIEAVLQPIMVPATGVQPASQKNKSAPNHHLTNLDLSLGCEVAM